MMNIGQAIISLIEIAQESGSLEYELHKSDGKEIESIAFIEMNEDLVKHDEPFIVID